MTKLVFFKSARDFPIGHISVTKTGQKIKKVAPGKWVQISEKKENKNLQGLTLKDGFYFDGKTKITNDYEKAKKYIQKKEENKPAFQKKENKNISIGDTIRVKANAKKGGIRETKGRGIVAKVKEIKDGIVKIIDDTGRMFQVQQSSLEFAKSGIIVNDFDLIKSEELKVGIKVEKEHANTVKKIKEKNLNETESAKLIAKDHIKEAKDKGYDYYKRLLVMENLEDYKGIEKKIIDYIKTHNFIKDEKGIHEFAKKLNINTHKLEEKIYAILKNIVGNKINKSKLFVFNLQKSSPIKYIKRIPKAGGGYKYIYKENQRKSKQNKENEINEKFKIGDNTNAGKIEEVYKDQVKINNQWYNKKIIKKIKNISKKEKNKQELSSIISKLKKERGEGFITLYHGTDIDSFNKINNSNNFGHEGISFLTNSKKEAKEYANNKTKYRGKKEGKVIEIKLPKWAIKKNKATGEFETEFELKKKNEIWLPTEKSILKKYLQKSSNLVFDLFKSSDNKIKKIFFLVNKNLLLKTVAGIEKYYNKIYGPGSYSKILVSKKIKKSEKKFDINVSPEERPEYLSSEDHERYVKAKKKLANYAGTNTHYGKGIVSQVKEKLKNKKEYMKNQKDKKFEKVMREFYEGKLKDSSGKLVTDKKRAIAIAFSESGK